MPKALFKASPVQHKPEKCSPSGEGIFLFSRVSQSGINYNITTAAKPGKGDKKKCCLQKGKKEAIKRIPLL